MEKKIFSACIFLLFAWVASPFLVPVAMGAIFAVLFFPALHFLEHRKFSTAVSSFLITLGLAMLVLIPSALLIFLGAKTGLAQVRVWREMPASESGSFMDRLTQTPLLSSFVAKLAGWFSVDMSEISGAAGDLARSMALWLAEFLGDFLRHLPLTIMGLAIMILTIYFFLVDGRKVVRFIRMNSFFDHNQTEHLIDAFAGLCRSVILASLISGMVQALIFTLACIGVGLDGILLIGFVVFLGSFVPLVGSSPVTFGIAVYHLLASGDKTTGIILLVVATLVTLMDNFIRPIVLKGSSNLHPLLGFIAAFGGLQMLGFSGVFVGPILAGLFVVTLENVVKTSPRL